MTMTTLAVHEPPAVGRLDAASLRRAFLVFAFVVAFAAPFSPDPVELAVGGLVPWVALWIVGTATMPAAIVYYLLYQWLQIFTRALVSVIDGEGMGQGLFGPWVLNAYWYSLASVVTLALVFRLALGSLKPPSPQAATAHLSWNARELFLFYLATFGLSIVLRGMQGVSGPLHQPMEAAARIKFVALFMLFYGVLSTRRGYSFLLGAVVMEMILGFSGLLGDFRAVFIVLFVAALSARIRWTGTTSVIVLFAGIFLVVLGVFWTAIKIDYREFATGSDDSQRLVMPIEERLGYIAGRVATVGDIDWSAASYQLLTRLAYIDIFGTVIGVKLSSPEQDEYRQWSDALAHVFQPRFLFPNKQELNDLDVYMRLARNDATEAVRLGTWISVGYMAENYVDFGFPGMLGGIFAMGLVIGLVTRYFMVLPLPAVVREGTVMTIIFVIGNNGIETSLPKILGSILMTFLAYALLAKFAYPYGLRWLDRRSRSARHAESLRQRRRAASRSS